MEDHERSRIVALLDGDAELRELWLEHQDFERQLAELDARVHLTVAEEHERRRLQKRKLVGKDRIVGILSARGGRGLAAREGGSS